MQSAVVRGFKMFLLLLQRTGPYVLIELLLPGGTLLALLLFLYQRRHAPAGAALSVPRVVAIWQSFVRHAWPPATGALRPCYS